MSSSYFDSNFRSLSDAIFTCVLTLNAYDLEELLKQIRDTDMLNRIRYCFLPLHEANDSDVLLQSMFQLRPVEVLSTIYKVCVMEKKTRLPNGVECIKQTEDLYGDVIIEIAALLYKYGVYNEHYSKIPRFHFNSSFTTGHGYVYTRDIRTDGIGCLIMRNDPHDLEAYLTRYKVKITSRHFYIGVLQMGPCLDVLAAHYTWNQDIIYDEDLACGCENMRSAWKGNIAYNINTPSKGECVSSFDDEDSVAEDSEEFDDEYSEPNYTRRQHYSSVYNPLDKPVYLYIQPDDDTLASYIPVSYTSLFKEGSIQAAAPPRKVAPHTGYPRSFDILPSTVHLKEALHNYTSMYIKSNLPINSRLVLKTQISDEDSRDTFLHIVALNPLNKPSDVVIAAIETLIKYGADPGIRNQDDKTAMDCAQSTRVRDHLKYRPGGTGYEEVKNHTNVGKNLSGTSTKLKRPRDHSDDDSEFTTVWQRVRVDA